LGFASGLRAFVLTSIVAVTVITVAAPVAAASSTTPSASTAAGRVVQVAELQRGKRYAAGAAGPSAFDCSGLVLFSYHRAGAGSRLGGGHSGYAMYRWAVAHHKFSRLNPQVGDVVVYGRGSHVAIYIGGGRVVSALNPRQGIRVTGLHALGQSVTGFIHTNLGPAQAKVVISGRAKAAPSAAAHRSVVARSWVNVRSGDSTGSRVLATVQPGTRLAVTGAALNHGVRWDRVLYRGHAAWVRADMVRAG
jgi:cell wall-associated NlpC family hydrolase